ncbi:MAG TPA: hypothetical protein VFN74_02140 [Chloroflexota bacterium]|nr:hypothetical protein [Chloroflexota bacterium]
MFHPTEKDWLPVVREEEIAGVIDSWGRVSEMPRELMKTVVYLAGMTGTVPGRDVPLRPWRPEDGEELLPKFFHNVRLDWQERIDSAMSADVEVAMRSGVVAWLTAGPGFSNEVLSALGVPTNELLLKRLPQIWPRLDELPPVVAFHYVCALSAWFDRTALSEAAARLVPEWPLPADGTEGREGLGRYFKWVRDVAAAQPVLALKVAVEAALRWRARHAALRTETGSAAH